MRVEAEGRTGRCRIPEPPTGVARDTTLRRGACSLTRSSASSSRSLSARRTLERWANASNNSATCFLAFLKTIRLRFATQSFKNRRGLPRKCKRGMAGVAGLETKPSTSPGFANLRLSAQYQRFESQRTWQSFPLSSQKCADLKSVFVPNCPDILLPAGSFHLTQRAWMRPASELDDCTTEESLFPADKSGNAGRRGDGIEQQTRRIVRSNPTTQLTPSEHVMS